MHIGLVGYGKMGASLFKVLAGKTGVVTVVLRDKEKAAANENKFFKGLERAVRRGAISEEELSRKRQSLRFTHRMADLASADLVIEAAVEDEDVKHRLFAELEAIISPSTILVTNTSSISIAKLRQALKHPERFCGLHFFHPLLLMELVEIVVCPDTSAELVSILREFCATIDKKPIVVLDAPGSVVNAILAYYYVESLYILEDGLALPSKIDAIAKQFFYVGPCESMDVIGVDFLVAALERSATPGSLSPIRWQEQASAELTIEDTGGREGFYIPHLFWKLLSEHRYGRKVGKGLYIYDKERPVDDAPEYYLPPNHAPVAGETQDAIIGKRLLFSILNGATYSYRKGMSSMAELDAALKEALHMSEGPFSMMRSIGEQRMREEFDFLTENVGKRFRQPDLSFLSA